MLTAPPHFFLTPLLPYFLFLPASDRLALHVPSLARDLSFPAVGPALTFEPLPFPLLLLNIPIVTLLLLCAALREWLQARD